MTIERFDIEDSLDTGALDWSWSETIGGSNVGHECDAYIGFTLRSFPTFDTYRMKRVFGLGHAIEDIVVRELSNSVFDVIPKDPATGKQYVFKAYGGMVKVKLDGVIKTKSSNTWSVLEVKSSNDSIYRQVDKHWEKNMPWHSQLQLGMLLSGLPQSVIVISNKNTSSLMSFKVTADDLTQGWLKARIEKQFTKNVRRVSTTKEYFGCKMCKFNSYCWEGRDLPVSIGPASSSCRSCEYAIPQATGSWECTLHMRPATAKCDDHSQWRPLMKE